MKLAALLVAAAAVIVGLEAIDASSWNLLNDRARQKDSTNSNNSTGPATLKVEYWTDATTHEINEAKREILYGGRQNDSIPSLGGYRRNMGLLLHPSDDETNQLQGCIAVRISLDHFITRASCVRDDQNLPTLFMESFNATGGSERYTVTIDTVTLHPEFGVNLAIVHVNRTALANTPSSAYPVALADVSPSYYVCDDSLTLVSIDNIFNPALAQNPRFISNLIRVPVTSCQYDSDDAAVNCYAPTDLASRELAFEFGQGMIIWKNLGLVGLPECEGLCSGGMFHSTTHLAKFKPWINQVTDSMVMWIRPVTRQRVQAVAPEHEPTFVSLHTTDADTLACGGALIAPRYVLTTASCVANHTIVSASVGHGKRDVLVPGHEDVIPVVGVHSHPQYQVSTSYTNDLAIIQLSAPTIYTPTMLASSDALSETDKLALGTCTPRLSAVDTSLMCVPPADACQKVGEFDVLASSGSSESVEEVSVETLLANSDVPSAVEQWNDDNGDAVFDVPEAARYYLLGLSLGIRDQRIRDQRIRADTNHTNSSRWCSADDSVGDDDNAAVVVRLATPETMEFIDMTSVDHTWRDPRQLPDSVLINRVHRVTNEESASVMASTFSISFTGELEFEEPPKDIDLGFVVGLRMDKFGQNFCGGSLIAPSFVLTAAHCVAGGNANFVAVGSRDSVGAEAELIPIMRSRVILHPQYGKRSLYSYDVAILELQSAAYPKPIVLDNSREINPVSYFTLLGYGANSASSTELSKELRSVDLPYFPRSKCATMFPELDASMFCAGGELARDACTGDSGSPLIRVVDGKPLLVGVVSSGRNGCGTPGVPGVYAWVAEMQSFIDSVVAGDSWMVKTSNTTPTRDSPTGTNETRTTDSSSNNDMVLRSSAVNMTDLPFEIINMGNGGSEHQLSIIELAQDTPARLQAAVMHFLVGDYENGGGWTPGIDQKWKISFYSTGDLTGIMQVIANHEDNPLYARKNRFNRPVDLAKASVPTYSSRGSCTGGHLRLSR